MSSQHFTPGLLQQLWDLFPDEEEQDLFRLNAVDENVIISELHAHASRSDMMICKEIDPERTIATKILIAHQQFNLNN